MTHTFLDDLAKTRLFIKILIINKKVKACFLAFPFVPLGYTPFPRERLREIMIEKMGLKGFKGAF